MINKEVSPGIQSDLYQVHHKNGTLSFIGNTKSVQKNRPFAFRNSSTPLSEANLVTKLQEASLPIREAPIHILGWGGNSVCFRVANSDTHFVAVLRSNREAENWEHLMNQWGKEKDINRSFSPYTIPHHLIIVSGIDNQPAVLKVTPEVPGAPISEVSGVYLFMNKQLMKQYIDIAKRNLRRFITTGIIADPIGHIKSARFISLFERYGLFFFDTSNIMVDFQKNSLVVVDCESDDLKKQPPHRKVQLFSRAFGMGVNIAILEVFKAANLMRDRIFSDPLSKTEVDNIPGIEQLNQGFAEAIRLFSASGLDYRVVGSFATAATINSAGGDYHLTPYRRDGTIRDIDILVLDQNTNHAKRLAHEFNAKRKRYPFCPRIELSLPKVFEKDKGYPENRPSFLPLIVTRSAMDRLGNFYLVYGGEHTQIPTTYLVPVCQTYEGVKFPTLEPGALAGLYLTRMGVFKSKDVEKVTTLLELTGAKIPTEFIDFSKILRTNWPNLYRNFLTREFMYHFSGGLIKKGLLSSLKSKFLR